MSNLWQQCLKHLEGKLDDADFYAWMMPLQAKVHEDHVYLYAPNSYVVDLIKDNYFTLIKETLNHLSNTHLDVSIKVGSAQTPPVVEHKPPRRHKKQSREPHQSQLDPHYTFSTFVEGKSNQLGKAAALQVAQNPGRAYNPLLLYGGTGLGKTHLMHAAGNLMASHNPDFKVLYLRSEQFVSAMIESLRAKNMDVFKRRYRSVDALLIDDIQLFAGKETTQEEFFHTFNALFEAKQQIILTCDRYPKEVEKLEPRLKSRLGWGLSVAIEPPDFETRTAILLSKAQTKNMQMPDDVAMLLADKIRSNVRDLEGALNTLAARAHFFNKAITTDFAKETLRDLLSTHAMAVSVPNIQKSVAEYYQIRLADLLSKRRARSVARPRQMAMALSKELTDHSLPEIGEAFGGRDHTTVLHACRTIARLMEEDMQMQQDWDQLIRVLSG